MTRRQVLAVIQWGSAMAVFGVLCVAMALARGDYPVQAQQQLCRAAIVLDRSGSVSASSLQTMKDQVSRLFQPPSIEVSPTTGGLYTDKVQLAFWTFASGSNNSNYNAPFYGFVSSKGTNSGFDTALRGIVAGGSTNYMQGMGYVNNTMNNRDGMDAIINQSEVIVFMTDGEPNAPNSVTEARNAGRTAALKHLAAGKVLLGGYIKGNNTQNDTQGHREVNYLINGDYTNYTNTFDVNSTYNNLAQQLKTQIGDKCGLTQHPCPTNPAIPDDDPTCKPPEKSPYSLTPTATTNNTVISGNDSATFSYTVQNNSTSTSSDSTTWSIKRLVVDRGQPVDPLRFNANEAYRDEYSCEKLLTLINNKGTCDDSGASGTRVFGTGTTTLSSVETGAASGTSVDDSWQVGTKLCFVLTLAQPTQNAGPKDRYSKASCVIVGKRPTFHAYGGDVTVGRRFPGDAPNSAATNVRGSLTTKAGSINRTFGSWVEYGVFAPGVVSGVASGSGLEGGYNGMVGSNQELWSNLTFANVRGDYGHFTNESGMGVVTDMANYFVQGRPVVQEVSGTEIGFKDDIQSGLYRKQNGSITLHESSLGAGKSVILYVPDGTVTIDGNIGYSNGPFTSIRDIPQLVIIARNITIKDTVTNIDAWLLAQDGDGKGGTIATCDKEPPLTSEMCNAPLTVNGPVAAKNLLLRRTGGSGTGNASGDPAEVFNLRADAYLWGYNEGRSAVRAETTFTTELPPQF